MISAIVEFRTKQDLDETLKRFNMTDPIVAPDNPLLVQIPVTPQQYKELAQLAKKKMVVKSIFEM